MQDADATLWLRRGAVALLATLLGGFIMVALAAREACAAERRVALVIGNSAYKEMPLRNPANDAAAVAEKLRKLDFEVLLARDAGQAAMRRAVATFADKLGPDATGLLFYAGHGLQVRGRNYLVPVDATIGSEARVVLEAVDLDIVLDQMSGSGARVSVAILDACRNNPFERSLRGSSPGLAQLVAPEGLLVAYATAPGRMAQDGDGEHGVYTGALLRHIDQPGLKIEDVLKRVRADVVRASAGAQVPWESSSLVGDLYLAAPGPQPVATAAPAPVDPARRSTAASANRVVEIKSQTAKADQWFDREGGRGGGGGQGGGPGNGPGGPK
jgi:uncharacterized caspase-like protein